MYAAVLDVFLQEGISKLLVILTNTGRLLKDYIMNGSIVTLSKIEECYPFFLYNRFNYLYIKQALP